MPEAAVSLRHCQVRFSGATVPALDIPALDIAPGERILLAGPTGAGKSTLLHLLLGLLELEPKAITGTLRFLDFDLHTVRPTSIARHVGAVFQTPGDQCLTAQVGEEVALGLRALELDEIEIASRVAQALTDVGLSNFVHHPPALLSGGQQQRLALACAIARQPDWLLLDEPFSQLDPFSAWDLSALIDRLTDERGMGFLIAEHRLELARRCVDRLITIEAGSITADFPMAHLPLPTPLPIPTLPANPQSSVRAKLQQVRVKYPESQHPALDITAELPGEGPLAIIGANGSGKSTLLSVLAGLRRPSSGKVAWSGTTPRIAWVPQNPDERLLGRSIGEDLALTGASTADITAIATRCQLPPTETAPLAASKGQRLQIAVASALLESPTLLLLDEPTTGQDPAHLDALVALLRDFPGLLIFTSHDLETVGQLARQVWILRDGALFAAGEPAAILGDTALLREAGLAPPAVSHA